MVGMLMESSPSTHWVIESKPDRMPPMKSGAPYIDSRWS